MSYHKPRRRGFGQTTDSPPKPGDPVTVAGAAAQATAYTCPNGTIIGVAPGVDPVAQCALQAANPQMPTDIATMPQPVPFDPLAPAPGTVAPYVAPTYYIPTGPPPAPSSAVGWLFPAVALGFVGLFWWASSAPPIKTVEPVGE